MSAPNEPSAAQLADLRAAIEAEIVELTALGDNTANDQAPVALDQQSIGRLSRMDAMQRQAIAAESGRRRTNRISRLKAALERISEGEYGYCSNCDEPISFGRLIADPAAQLCLNCAEAAETGGKN